MGTPTATDAGTQASGDTPATGPQSPAANAASAGESSPGPGGRPAAKVALVGVHGFGTHHLRNLERLQAAGVVDLVAVADPNPPAAGSVPETAHVFPGLTELLAETTGLDLIIVATPRTGWCCS